MDYKDFTKEMLTKAHWDAINQPPILSLLYDIGLMPEQVKDGSIELWKMLQVVSLVDAHLHQIAALKSKCSELENELISTQGKLERCAARSMRKEYGRLIDTSEPKENG